MTDSLAEPWHERHKGVLTLWGLLGTSLGIVGVVFRADLRPLFATFLAPLGASWRWLATAHAVPGWLLLVLLVTGAFGVSVAAWALLAPENSKRFAQTIEGVQWEGWITSQGEVLRHFVPHCPLCQCELHIGNIPHQSGSRITTYGCEDCHGTFEVIDGSPSDIAERITRILEAMWRRGELSAKGKAKSRLQTTPLQAQP